MSFTSWRSSIPRLSKQRRKRRTRRRTRRRRRRRARRNPLVSRTRERTVLRMREKTAMMKQTSLPLSWRRSPSLSSPDITLVTDNPTIMRARERERERESSLDYRECVQRSACGQVEREREREERERERILCADEQGLRRPFFIESVWLHMYSDCSRQESYRDSGERRDALGCPGGRSEVEYRVFHCLLGRRLLLLRGGRGRGVEDARHLALGRAGGGLLPTASLQHLHSTGAMFSRSLARSLRIGAAFAPRSAVRTPAYRAPTRGYAVAQSGAARVTCAWQSPFGTARRYYSAEEERKEEEAVAEATEASVEETVSGEEPAPAQRAPMQEQPERIGGPFRVMVTNVPTEAMNRDVRFFLARAGHVCWLRRLRADQNNGNAVIVAEFLTEDEAKNAIETLNGEELEGENVSVEPDTSGVNMQLPSRLMVKNLPYSYDEFMIRELVAGYEVQYVNLVHNDRGFSGMATVKFSNQDEAKRAMATLVESVADGRRLLASFQGSIKRNDRPRSGGNREFRGRNNNNRNHEQPQGGQQSGRRYNNSNYYAGEE
mmetsp:Transcript_22559/g.89228  ORF Transcript_22559/g.89228 Transcript_22559/m.89228 type:complete len:548 (-) Transcript_22559:111-1754(-)